ncbi:C-type lectin domain family 12 member B-like isoform X2 [Aquarana catesbeiana]|uniref:C-type lectin domain family 12 member B-like isoform X2 n=1 Tax=Aquarana catesbeiana TaxID=8400 RepID=UPI003CC99698
MTDAVTYADLKFEDIVMKENDYRDDEDNGSDHGDIMYENVDTMNPPRFRDLPDPPDNPANKREHRLLSRSEKYLLFLSILFGLLFIATAIGMSVKYISESRELKHLSKHFAEMNDSLSQRLQSKEDLLTSTKNDLETTQKNLEQLVRDLCPENWIMVGKKCLLINEEPKSWYESERQCLQVSANLLTVQRQDEALKSFFSNKGDYWLGKEIKWYQWSNWNQWTWPLGDLESWRCWKISNGEFVTDPCQNRNKWICERDILLGKYISKTSDNPLGFRLKETEYQCKKKKN